MHEGMTEEEVPLPQNICLLEAFFVLPGTFTHDDGTTVGQVFLNAKYLDNDGDLQEITLGTSAWSAIKIATMLSDGAITITEAMHGDLLQDGPKASSKSGPREATPYL